MPMRKMPNETGSDFMKRCISHYIDKKPRDQAVAICMNMAGIKKEDLNFVMSKMDVQKAENEDMFMMRCMAQMQDEGYEATEAGALCQMMWQETAKAESDRGLFTDSEQDNELTGGMLTILSP